MMHSIGNGEGDLMSAPLSVSRSMAKSFGELSQFTEDPQCNFFEMKCVGKMLVSLVSISPSTINFGDCNVGDFKSASINLTNISDTLAILVPYFESDTITLSVKHIILKPGQSSRVTIDYVVRIIDPAYSKTIMFVNLLAPLSELKLEIRARNADTHQMLLHDIFYKLYTYSGSRQTILYSSCCMFRCPTVRLFSIRNVFSEPLEMKLTADNGNEVSLFCLENIIIESDGDFLKALKAVKIHPFELRQDVASISSSRRNPAREKEKFNASLFKRDDITVTKDVNVESIVESITALYKISSDVSKAVTRMMIKATVNDSGCSPLPGEKGPVYNYTNSLISEINGDAEDHVVRQCEQYLDTFQKVKWSTILLITFNGYFSRSPHLDQTTKATVF